MTSAKRYRSNCSVSKKNIVPNLHSTTTTTTTLLLLPVHNITISRCNCDLDRCCLQYAHRQHCVYSFRKRLSCSWYYSQIEPPTTITIIHRVILLYAIIAVLKDVAAIFLRTYDVGHFRSPFSIGGCQFLILEWIENWNYHQTFR